MKKKYDVIVVGGGHAGTEAAAASSRIGAKTCVITKSVIDLGQLSCNPSIGGVAKGIIVKEIDALDGIMSKVIDKSCIHFKMLNKSKGPAVWGPRAQADRALYKKNIENILFNYQNLDLLFLVVDELIIFEGKVRGVICGKNKIFSNSVVVTSGTFLNGKVYVGKDSFLGGRLGEKSISRLSEKLKLYNFKIKRLKTGTPPRICKKSINFRILEKQLGDKIPQPFSDLTKVILQRQVPCYITYTNKKTHNLINENLSQSAIYSGNINSLGPRYCPSIEDKIIRFKDKKRHQVFLEPESLDSNFIYPNGISTSLPHKIQEEFIKTIVGLENAKIIQYGYAVEYDFIDPRKLEETLESREIKNLFFAGQINGTTGYEEAAGQGIVAGANAALKQELKYLILSRNDSYIGVMINDLINFGVQEPYRIMTSRAEYRIKLRSDNASERLTYIGNKYGLITFKKQKNCNDILKQKVRIKNFLKSKSLKHKNGQNYISNNGLSISKVKKRYSQIINIDEKILINFFAERLYKSYEKRLLKDIEILNSDKAIILPKIFNFNKINGLSHEIKVKLKSCVPRTIADIKRIKGITPSALVIIMIFIKKKYDLLG